MALHSFAVLLVSIKLFNVCLRSTRIHLRLLMGNCILYMSQAYMQTLLKTHLRSRAWNSSNGRYSKNAPLRHDSRQLQVWRIDPADGARRWTRWRVYSTCWNVRYVWYLNLCDWSSVTEFSIQPTLRQCYDPVCEARYDVYKISAKSPRCDLKRLSKQEEAFREIKTSGTTCNAAVCARWDEGCTHTKKFLVARQNNSNRFLWIRRCTRQFSHGSRAARERREARDELLARGAGRKLCSAYAWTRHSSRDTRHEPRRLLISEQLVTRCSRRRRRPPRPLSQLQVFAMFQQLTRRIEEHCD